MKKILFALLMFAGLLTLAPQAEARGWSSRYDYCGRPAYGYPYYSGYSYRPRAYSYYRPSYYRTSYYRPVRSYYYRDYDYCAPRIRYYSPRPRFSFFFGF
jgi:hypothetical protein